jgi:hypothetical protein
MERMAWTDQRLDDLSNRMGENFRRMDADIRELRAEVRQQGTDVRGEIDRLRLAMIRVGAAGFLGMIAAIIARG